MASDVRLRRIETKIPARMDRLPWSRFHWMVVVGLGTVWILDGLEVTMVGSVAARLTEDGSGIGLTPGQIGTAAAVYIAGACLGALFFGQLTDRFGRKKLFIATLALYVVATVATAFSFDAWYFYLMRFFTGAGIGGEYAAINSAIDELIPARVRGRVDLIINGSYWLGAAAGAGAAVFFLDTTFFALDVGWRVAFGVGAAIGLVILVVRRHVPESPRWLFIHGREEEAEGLVDRIERGILEEVDDHELPEPQRSITVRQRKTIPFRQIGRTAFKLYPRRAVLGLALFVGQAFLYNAVTFNLGTLLNTFYGVAAATVPVFIVVWAFGNFLGPVTLGRLFDTVGRKPMIAGCYLGSAAVIAVLGVLFVGDVLTEWWFLAVIFAAFFIASAGASSAYLTVSEIFPMETRALAIAFFYAAGTAAGGIAGPLLFGNLIGTGEELPVAIGFWIGAGVMAIGGIAEIAFGVKAEKAELEAVAKPLTAEEGEEEPAAEAEEKPAAAEGEEEPAAEAEEKLPVGTGEEEPPAEAGEKLPVGPGGGEAPVSEAAELARRAHERRMRRWQRERAGRRRFRPGPGSLGGSPGMPVSAPVDDAELDREIDIIARALDEHGTTSRRELARMVGARYWGPGRFRTALREAIYEGSVRRVSRATVAPARLEDGAALADRDGGGRPEG